MGQILVRNVDDAVLERLRKRAEHERTSLEQTVRNILAEAARPSRTEIVEDARLIRERIGRVTDDSTEIIRMHRDNDEPYR